MKLKERIELDKFFTKSDVASLCYTTFKKYIPKNSHIIEPSAGSGSFLNIIEEEKTGFDIRPEHDDIICLDFLNNDISSYIKPNSVFLGNPPFGKKSKLAIQFLNKCLEYSDYVGFIVPIQFRKWSVQSNIKEESKLLLDIDLPLDSFTIGDKSYDVACCFQIWTNIDCNDLRIGRPNLEHSDFNMYQYNRTNDTLKYFNYDWDFAIVRQGYLDYTKIYTNKEDCDKKHQWIFFKAHNKEILDRLLNLDYVKLSKLNSKIPGFGKADVIKEYNSKYKPLKVSKIEALFE